MSKNEENKDLNENLESKFKLSLLNLEKRLIDLEVALSETKEKIKSIENINVEELKQRIEDVEDLSYVENAAIIEFKKILEEIKEKFQDIKNISLSVNELQNKLNEIEKFSKSNLEFSPTNISERLGNLENTVVSLRALVSKIEKNLYEKFSEIDNKLYNVDFGKIFSKIENMSYEIDDIKKNRMEIELKISEFENIIGLLKEDIKKSLSENLLNEIKNIRKDSVRINALEEVTKNITDEISKLNLELKKFESLDKLTNLSKSVDEKIEIIKFLEGEIKRISSKVETIYENLLNEIEKIRVFETKINVMNDIINNLKLELDSTKLSVLEKAKKKEIEEFSLRLTEAEKRISSISDFIQEISSKLGEVKKAAPSVVLTKEEVRDLINRIVFLETRISAMEKYFEDINKARPIIIE